MKREEMRGGGRGGGGGGGGGGEEEEEEGKVRIKIETDMVRKKGGNKIFFKWGEMNERNVCILHSSTSWCVFSVCVCVCVCVRGGGGVQLFGIGGSWSRRVGEAGSDPGDKTSVVPVC